MNEDRIYPSMVIRSQGEAIELLQKENQQLKSQLKQSNNINAECKKFVSSLISKGRDCMIYEDVKKDILDILNKRGGTDE